MHAKNIYGLTLDQQTFKVDGSGYQLHSATLSSSSNRYPATFGTRSSNHYSRIELLIK